MVWTASVIHAFRGTCPMAGPRFTTPTWTSCCARASIYPGMSSFEVEALQALEEWNLNDRKQGLSYGAFAAHRWLDIGAAGRRQRRASAGSLVQSTVRDLADDFLAGYFKSQAWSGPATGKPSKQAREFASLMAERSGVLLEEADGFHFGDHLTMQEFLAGLLPGRITARTTPRVTQRLWRQKYRRDLVAGGIAAGDRLPGGQGVVATGWGAAAPASAPGRGAGPTAGCTGVGRQRLRAVSRCCKRRRAGMNRLCGELAGQLVLDVCGAPRWLRPIAGARHGRAGPGPAVGLGGPSPLSGPAGLPGLIPIPAGPFVMGQG